MQRSVVIAAGLGLVGVAVAAAQLGGEQLGAAVVIGAIGGMALHRAAFGFAGSWRRFMRTGRGAGLRAQMLLLAAGVLIAHPLIQFAPGVNGWVFPLGAASAIGAAMFGVGMQLGGGCGSGVLFTAGGGSVRMLLTLASFIAGSVLWTGTAGAWAGMAHFSGYSFIQTQGVWLAMLGALAAAGLIAALSVWVEKRRFGGLEPARASGVLSDHWPLWLSALVLAGVIGGTLLTLGRPWGITSAFSLWGVKALSAAGVPIGDWNGWSPAQIARPIFSDATSVMNFGVMLGALAAAGLSSRFAPSIRMSAKDALTAVIGGLLMGYGARLAWGCNIGGFIGGVVSGSLHGWWWLLFGAAGAAIGVWTRAWIGMDPPLWKEKDV